MSMDINIMNVSLFAGIQKFQDTAMIPFHHGHTSGRYTTYQSMEEYIWVATVGTAIDLEVHADVFTVFSTGNLIQMTVHLDV